MDDNFIINYFVNKRGMLNSSRCAAKNIERHPEIKSYLLSRYDEFNSYKETISRIFHKIEVIPLCKVCGKKLKFQKFSKPYGIWCGCKCQLRDTDFISYRNNKIDWKNSVKVCKETKLKRYGDENYCNRKKFKETCIERYGVEAPQQNKEIHDKSIDTCLKKYGVDNISKIDSTIDKIKRTKYERYGEENFVNPDKAKITFIERYGVENYMLTEEFDSIRKSEVVNNKRKESTYKKYGDSCYFKSDDFKKKRSEHNYRKYGVEFYSQTDEYKEKSRNTRIKNSTFNSSSVEEKLKKYLNDNGINFISQYKSDLYPYNCDFYFPDKDLYLEIQGMWTHGGHPFNDSDCDDIKKLNIWISKNNKFYNNAVRVWSITDVEKRNTAMKNGLNFLEIFTHDFDEVKLKINEIFNIN